MSQFIKDIQGILQEDQKRYRSVDEVAVSGAEGTCFQKIGSIFEEGLEGFFKR